MDGDIPPIDVRLLRKEDAVALHKLDYSFETDRIYTLCVQGRLVQEPSNGGSSGGTSMGVGDKPVLAFELRETLVDPPIYKGYISFENTLEDVEASICDAQGGYVALAGGEVAGAVFLNVEEWRSVAHIEHIVVGHQFRRYGIGSLLLSCACDWARNRGCWAIQLETQNVNYPAIQFYLRNGLEVWSINQHFYPPGPVEHEIAIFMGKRLK